MTGRTRLMTGVAVIALGWASGIHGTALANGTDTGAEIAAMRAEMQRMADRLAELEAQQAETAEQVEDTRERAVLSTGNSPGSFILPGTNTEFEVSGYVKADFIYDFDESTGDLFVPESISTDDDDDEERFRAHARQSRLRIKTSTPTDLGTLGTHLEGDFFGSGGNEVFSNSTSFRLRHAYGTIGPFLAGQTWSNFMPIESYPTTVDFNGPAGIPFVRQAQLRYTTEFADDFLVSASLENSEFSGRSAAGTFSESTNLGIRAGVDQAPDVTAALTYTPDWGLLKLAGVGRYLGSPFDTGDGDFGWGVNLSGNATPWAGGLVQGSATYGEGVGRYILNGFGQDGFVDADGDVEAIEAWGVTVAVRQQFAEDWAAGLAYGRFDVEDSFAPDDLDNVNTVHASLFWTPVDRLAVGAEVIWGDREDADGESDDAFRAQGAVQVNF